MPELFPLPAKNNPNARLAFLAVLLILVGASMYSCREMYLGPGSVSPDPGSQTLVDVEGKPAAADPFPGVAVQPRFRTEYVADFVKRDDAIRDLTAVTAPLGEVFAWLKGQTPEALAGQARPRSRWSFDKVMREPDRWRLQLLHVYGMLARKDTVEFPDAPEGLRKLYLLYVWDPSQNEIHAVLTPVMPRDAGVPQANRNGSFLSFDGVFLLRYSFVAERGRKAVPLYAARRVVLTNEFNPPRPLLDERGDPGATVEELRPLRTVERLDEAFLREKMFAPPKSLKGYDVYGGDAHEDVRDIRSEKECYDHLFEYVWHFTDEDLPREANPELTYVNLMEGDQPPDWMRFRVAYFEGVVTAMEPWRFSDAKNGVQRIYVLIAPDTRLSGFTFTWALAVMNLPEGLREGDAIGADGVYAKLYPYRTNAGKWQWAPLLVCKSIRRIPPPPPSYGLYVLLAVLVFGGMGLIYWASQRDTEHAERLRKHIHDRRLAYDQKCREEAERKKAASAPTPLAADAVSSLASSPDNAGTSATSENGQAAGAEPSTMVSDATVKPPEPPAGEGTP